jgi:transcriptional regulator with XRE-family HTH domain
VATEGSVVEGRRDHFEHLGLALTVLRLYRGLSQAELAERAGIRSNQISRYETGQVLPQLQQLGRILGGLRVDLAELLLALDMLGRLARHLDGADRPPAEAVARQAVASFWAQTSDLQLSLARQVCRLLEQEPVSRPASSPRRR